MAQMTNIYQALDIQTKSVSRMSSLLVFGLFKIQQCRFIFTVIPKINTSLLLEVNPSNIQYILKYLNLHTRHKLTVMITVFSGQSHTVFYCLATAFYNFAFSFFPCSNVMTWASWLT